MDTHHNNPQQAFWDKTKTFWEHLLHVLSHVIFLWEWQAFDKFYDDDYVGSHTWVTLTVSLYYLCTLLISIRK